MKKIIIFVIVVIVLVFGLFFIFRKDEIKMPKYMIKKYDDERCKISYGKLCINIPDDYKCVGANKCQLSNNKDMLLVQVYLDEKYEDTLTHFIESGQHDFPTHLVDIEKKVINEKKWTTARNLTGNEKYYFIKYNHTVYSVKLLFKKDSGGKFDELTKVVEDSLLIHK